jgi:hypothetical protein
MLLRPLNFLKGYLMRLFIMFFALTIIFSLPAYASWKVTVANMQTHEERYFSPPTDREFKLPINFGPWECKLIKEIVIPETVYGHSYDHRTYSVSCKLKGKNTLALLKTSAVTDCIPPRGPTELPATFCNIVEDDGHASIMIQWDKERKIHQRFIDLEWKD